MVSLVNLGRRRLSWAGPLTRANNSEAANHTFCPRRTSAALAGGQPETANRERGGPSKLAVG
jgi:hypothetical protein